MKKIIYVLVLVSVLFIPITAGASDLTARSFGMGGAFTAVADSVETILYNPAGMANSGFVGVNTNGGFQFGGIEGISDLLALEDNINNDQVVDIIGKVPDDVSFSSQFLMAAKLRDIGLSYNIINDSSAQLTAIDSARAYINNDQEGSISFGSTLLKPPFELGSFTYGFNVKIISKDRVIYDINDTSVIEQNTSGSGFGVDAGILTKVSDNLRVGLQIKNVLASNISLEGKKKKYSYDGSSWQQEILNDSYQDNENSGRPAMQSRIGAALVIPIVDLTLAADIDNLGLPGNTGEGQVIHFGLEKSMFLDGFTIRAGNISGKDKSINTFGFGFNLTGFHLDTAFGSSDGFKDNITAIASANFDF